MTCQKCSFPHANPLGCLSCGWKYDPDYHPSIGAAPLETAQWLIDQPEEVLVKLYGPVESANKLAAARQILATQKTGDTSTPAPPPVIPTVITHTVEPVASPFAPEPEVVPEPVVDERIHATEAPAPGTV